MRELRAPVILIALALAGCSQLIGSAEPETGSGAPPPPSSAGTKASAPSGSLAALPPVPVPPPKERPGPALDPERLLGLTQEETRRLMGTPGGVREEPPAVVWTYASAGCGLDVFFYMDLANQAFRALAYDLKPKGRSGLAGGACLASLRTTSHD